MVGGGVMLVVGRGGYDMFYWANLGRWLLVVAGSGLWLVVVADKASWVIYEGSRGILRSEGGQKKQKGKKEVLKVHSTDTRH